MVEIPMCPPRLRRLLLRRPRKLANSRREKFDMNPEEYEEARRHFEEKYRAIEEPREMTPEEMIRRLRGF